MRLTNKMLGSLHRVFNKDPQRFLALRINCDSGQMTWSVADGMLALTPAGATEASPLSLDLSQYTIQSLANFLTSQAGYLVIYQDTSKNQFLSALVLIDGSGDVQQSNGDHLYAYTNSLWAFVNANGSEIEFAQSQIVNMLAQMSTTTAQNEFLDNLGAYYAAPRNPGELDTAYSQRIPASVLLPSSNNVGMAVAVKAQFPGSTVSIPDAVTNKANLLLRDGSILFNSAALHNSGVGTISNGMFDVNYSYDFASGLAPTAIAPTVAAAVNKNRASGTSMRNLVISNGPSANVLVQSYALGNATVFVYDQATVFSAADDISSFFEDDEPDWEMYLGGSSTENITVQSTQVEDAFLPWFDESIQEDDQDFSAATVDQYIDLGNPPVPGALSGDATDTTSSAAALTAGGSSGQFKFSPGNIALSTNVNGSPSPYGSGANASDLSILSANGLPKVIGYRTTYDWASLEATQNTYNFQGIIADFNALQTSSPGATFGIHLTARVPLSPALTYTQAAAKTLTAGLPGWILNCTGSITVRNAYGSGSTTVYPLAKQKNNQYGFSFAGWNAAAATYNVAVPAFWDPGVARAFANLGQALAQTSFTTTAGPFAGQTFTFNTHPLIEAICDANDYSVNVASGQGSFNPPAQVSAANAPTAENYFANSFIYWSAWQKAFTKTCVEVLYSFGFTGSDADVPGNFAARLEQLAGLPGLTFAATDTFGTAFAASSPTSSYGQQAYLGVEIPASGPGTTLPALGAAWTFDSPMTLDTSIATFDGTATYVNQIPHTSLVQAADYGTNLGSGIAANSAAAVNAIIATTSVTQPQKVVWSLTDSTGSSSAWAAYIYPTFTGSATQPSPIRPSGNLP